MEQEFAFTRRIFDFFRQASSGQAGTRRPGRLLEAALFQRGQSERRRREGRRGLAVPPILIASLTRRCNLDCEGCYSKVLRPFQTAAAEISDARFMELFREAIDIGVGTIILAGGEPLLRRELVEEAARLPGVLLPLFTNGTLLDDGLLDRLAGSSVVPILSVEGEAADTDARRGSGIHRSALARMEAMRSRGMLYGASITLTSRNADHVLSRSYLEGLAASGISVLFLVEFVPVQAGTRDLVLEAGQKARLDAKEAFEGLPFPVVVLPGDEAAYGGCLAAGRGFVHLSPEGSLEACPFAPFSDTNAAQAGLRSALGSPLMRAIRERHAELSENSGGCALWDKAGWVGSLASCSRAAPPPAMGHAEERLHAAAAGALHEEPVASL